MRDHRHVYSICAVIVPVSLGLGLLYLAIIGGIEFSAVIICLVGLMALVPFVAVLADLARENPRSQQDYRRRRRRRPEGAAWPYAFTPSESGGCPAPVDSSSPPA